MGRGGGGGGRGRCYVGNLPYSAGWQDLKDLFRSAGRVLHADVMMEDGGRSKGWGIVEFETEAEVRDCCHLSFRTSQGQASCRFSRIYSCLVSSRALFSCFPPKPVRPFP